MTVLALLLVPFDNACERSLRASLYRNVTLRNGRSNPGLRMKRGHVHIYYICTISLNPQNIPTSLSSKYHIQSWAFPRKKNFVHMEVQSNFDSSKCLGLSTYF